MIYGLMQIAIIALVVAFSLVQVGRKIMPQTARSVQARLARSLRGKAMPPVLQRFGERLQPAEVPAKGCGSGCGSCNMCGTIAALTKDIPRA